MIITPIRTRACLPPKDNLRDIYISILPLLKERMIVAISSKVVAIEEGRCLPVADVKSKDELIFENSEQYLPREHTPGRWVVHTITEGMLIPSAGIDESNANDHYILWPEDPNRSAERICQLLKRESGIKCLGVVVTDSHSIPLRRGVVGMSIGYCGFEPMTDYRGQKDLFGREMKVSQANLPDGFAAAAVLAMGEGAEQTPIALIFDVANTVIFNENGDQEVSERPFARYEVAMGEDLYYPFFNHVPWKPGGKDPKSSFEHH